MRYVAVSSPRRRVASGRILLWQQATDVPLADISASVQAAFIDVTLLAVRPVSEAL
jgi:hypothetical protein